MHIIINRIALIMCDARRVRTLKWAVTVVVGTINIVSWPLSRPAIDAVVPGRFC